MSRKKKHEVDDKTAKEALRYGGKSGAVPTHSAMQDPDADATDAEPDDDSNEDEDNDNDFDENRS
jgi:ribosomal protein L12E/L44/L45/RPP1/RPP2